MAPDCPICQAPGAKCVHAGVCDHEHGLGHPADFFGCEACGCLFQFPPPLRETLQTLYPADYRPYVTKGLLSRLKSAQGWLLALSMRRNLPKTGRILELGPGGGHFLRALRTLGYEHLEAIDWSASLAPVMEAAGIRFRAEDIEEADLEGEYGAIVLNNVIEHVIDPIKLLARLRGHVANGGKLLLTTPNAASASHRLFGKRWSGLHSPRHVHVFTCAAVAEFASRAGFRSVELTTIADPSAWAVSVQNLLRASRAPEEASPQRATHPLTTAMIPCFLPIAWLESMLGAGSSIRAALAA